jgi:serine/threonine-protein kinase
MTEQTERLTRALADRYAIERELGEGGMATVYLAHDLKHDRKVALKVLKPELAAVVGGERFLAEIRVTANLQHPHILPLFDSGQADGFLFYVMPWVEGESLRERLEREHQLPIEEALAIAAKMGAALQYAHEQGVVHRDVKPANVLMSRGDPLVSDFGIALALSEAGGGRITETGLSLGTPHYMSPEQAAGERSLDKRSDLYALGCVLYEMLTGEPPYSGPTAQAILGRILTADAAPLTEHRKAVPLHVEHAVLKALEKLPADRFDSIDDFLRALRDRSFRRGEEAASGGARVGGSPGLRWAVVAVVGILAFAAGAMGRGFVQAAPEARTMRERVELLSHAWSAAPPTWVAQYTALEPRGGGIVYGDSLGSGEDAWILWWKAGSEADAVPLPGTGNGLAPAFSPDGQWLAFIQGGELRKRPLAGGASILLADSAGGGTLPGLGWLDDGTIVYEGADFGVYLIGEDGGGTELVATREQVGAPLQISGLVGGGGVLVVGCRSPGDVETVGTCPPGTAVLSLIDHRRDTIHALADEVVRAWEVEEGRIVFADARGTVFTAPLDRDALSLGIPIPLFDGVQGSAGSGEMQLARDGSVLVRRGPTASGDDAGQVENTEFVWVSRSGEIIPVDPGWRFDFGGANYGWRLSPDGSRVAFRRRTAGNNDVWIKELPDGPVRRLTFDDGEQRVPWWTPDGREVTYLSGPTGQRHVWRSNADYTGEPAAILEEGSYAQGLWSPDGQWLVLRSAGLDTENAQGQRDIVAFRPGVDSAPSALVATGFAEEAPALSPDGRWLAYASNETGRYEVFVSPFPEAGAGKVQVSRDGGITPRWAHGGSELFFVDGERRMVAARVETAPTFRVTGQEPIFAIPGEVLLNSITDFYSVAPGDERFLMARVVGQGPDVEDGQTPLVLIRNFLTEVRERAGG